MLTAPAIVIADEVRDALAEGRPVVALESTIVTHGMPHPANIETARAVEAEVRAGGAVPATIAIVDGIARVGLEAEVLARLAAAKDVAKASRRDLAVLAARRASAGTTVAATMIIAAKTGIPVFATGGIGGVHRGAETSFDVSADLVELGRTPVAVVSAGAKSILDLPKTLEVLETEGVPVIGYRTDAFPAFLVRDSGLPVAARCDSPEELAAVVAAQRDLGLGGMLIVNPIDAADALDAGATEAAVAAALAEAAAAGITGKDVTPFLLSRLVAVTEGASLTANIALIRSNARLAAAIAVALAALDRAR